MFIKHYLNSLSVLPLVITLLVLQGCGEMPRGPYLQNPSANSVVVKWTTSILASGKVEFGLSSDNLENAMPAGKLSNHHEIEISGLQPDTTYYYRVNSNYGFYSDVHSFTTLHEAGDTKPFRVWLIGDSGTADEGAAAVRDSFYEFNGGPQTDLWIMLGDNAYRSGTEKEYQEAVFDMYPLTLATTPLYSTLGNHDVWAPGNPYFDIFTLPTNGEAGGVPSGSEHYYSFDYGNVHFVCLDSESSDRALDGAMASWLISDLESNTQDWTVVFFHHPPYSKGSHDSDKKTTDGHITDMRENFTPLFDQYGVDLVFSGHSHSYERSYPIVGHTGQSRSFEKSMKLDSGDGREDGDGAYEKAFSQIEDSGVIYTVAGSSGKAINAGSLDHPVFYSAMEELGSVVLDFHSDRVDATFVSPTKGVSDYYTVKKF